MRLAILLPIGAGTGIFGARWTMDFIRWAIENGVEGWQFGMTFLAAVAFLGLALDRLVKPSNAATEGRAPADG